MSGMADPADDLLADQLRYYRARAAEFDLTAYGVEADRHGKPKSPVEDERIVDRLDLAGNVLELACGTGAWTQHIARTARSVLAVDLAPEMLDVARAKVRLPNVSFLQADALSWTPDRTFDAVFFAFWLSHVPPSMFDRFWLRLAEMLSPGGRVIVVDELVDRRELETDLTVEDDLPVARRKLRDGSTHRLVKVFYLADELRTTLTRLGWTADVTALPRGLFLLEAQLQG
jgi:ubiquinone/menaquinone biosynthesis C-methylase UbiE